MIIFNLKHLAENVIVIFKVEYHFSINLGRKFKMLHSAGTLSPQDILSEVRKFISGAVRPTHNTSTLDVTRTALFLLRNVPAARDAVLEYFCNVFFVAVTKHVRQIEVSPILGIICQQIYFYNL